VPVNPDLAGRSYPPAEPYLVGREKVREFAHAVLATSPLSFDVEAARAAGYADLVAPPTFPIVIQQRTWDHLIGDPDAGIELSRVLHGEQRFSITRPIVAGDELTARLTVTGLRSIGGNTMVTADTVIVDAAGEHVATATSVLVVGADPEVAA
jgi:acyl dehydratase